MLTRINRFWNGALMTFVALLSVNSSATELRFEPDNARTTPGGSIEVKLVADVAPGEAAGIAAWVKRSSTSLEVLGDVALFPDYPSSEVLGLGVDPRTDPFSLAASVISETPCTTSCVFATFFVTSSEPGTFELSLVNDRDHETNWANIDTQAFPFTSLRKGTYTFDDHPCLNLAVNSGSAQTPQNCTGGYTSGTVVTIVANNPPEGQTFDRWTGDAVASATSSTTTITMNANKTVTATYKPIPPCFNLTIINGSTQTPQNCTGGYTSGTVVTIVANNPPTGQTFDRWTGDAFASATSSTTTITMNANKTVTATYKPIPPCFNLAVNSGSAQTPQNCTGGYTDGTVVTIVANNPPEGQTFDRWTGDAVASATSSTTTITMDANKTVTATYKPKPQCLNLTVNSGSAQTPQNCTGGYTDGTVVTIVANNPPEGQTFDRWTGDAVASATSSTTTITMDANKTVTATYKQGPNCVAAPATVTATEGDLLRAVRVDWTQVDGATGYKVYRAAYGDSFDEAELRGTLGAGANSFNDMPAPPGFDVWRIDSLGCSTQVESGEDPPFPYLQCGTFDPFESEYGQPFYYWVVALGDNCESTPAGPAVGYANKEIVSEPNKAAILGDMGILLAIVAGLGGLSRLKRFGAV